MSMENYSKSPEQNEEQGLLAMLMKKYEKEVEVAKTLTEKYSDVITSIKLKKPSEVMTGGLELKEFGGFHKIV